MPTKSKILIFIDWFYPAFKAGGPIKSVFNVIQNLKDDYDFAVVTSDKDIDGTKVNEQINQYTNVEIGQGDQIELDHWVEKDGYKVMYLSPDRQMASVYKEIAIEIKPDWVYYNSMFSKKFTLKPYRALKKIGIKQMIAPRGMLGKGALSIKPFKKKVFLESAKRLLFDKRTYWHATSQQEAREIEQEVGVAANRIRVASNLASPLPQDCKIITLRQAQGDGLKDCKIRIFFLSRISKKKNLLFILELMKELPELENMTLDIFGPIENDGHWEKCKPLIDADQRITYNGEIHPQSIPKMIAEYHLMVLPTLHENYGHVIAETLSQGRPVLISDQTPWRGLEEKKIGFDISLEDKEEWKKRMVMLNQMDDDTYQEMSAAAFEYAKQNIVNSSLIKASKALFAIDE